MEVTRRNFNSVLPKILPLLETASFISFDAEFSGLGRGKPENKFSDLDTPSERYVKIRDSVVEYGLIQLGVTLFRYSSEKDTFFTSTFSFLISGKEQGFYKVDTSSANFLAENNFDFNKLFLEGLPFMTVKEEKDIREERARKNLEDLPVSTPLKIKDDKARTFVKESNNKISQAIQNKEKSVIFSGKVMNNFLRKLLYNNVAPNFPNTVFRSMKGNDRDIEALIFDSILEKETFCGSSWEDNLNYEMGITRFIKAVMESNKPLVGHNVILDVLHFVDKFVIDLPHEFGEFQKVLRNNLPDIYDTKLLAKDPPFSARILNTALNPLYEQLSNNCGPVSLEVEEGFKSYTIATDDGQYHEAGYDAFMTGVCFLIMVKVHEGQQFCKKPLMESKALTMYKNKINFVHSYDISFLDLHNSQVIPDRSGFISVQCPSTFTSTDSRQLLASFSGYKLIWINENLFHVLPQSDDEIDTKLAIQTMKQVAPLNLVISSYEDHMRSANSMLNSSNTDLETTISSTDGSINNHEVSNGFTGGSCSISDGDNYVTGSNKTGKRRPEEEDDSGGSQTTESRELKRLKSVGSDRLSELTLESPTNEDRSIAQKLTDNAKKEEFVVPEDW